MSEQNIDRSKIMVTINLEIADESEFISSANRIIGTQHTKVHDIVRDLASMVMGNIPGKDVAMISTSYVDEWLNDRQLISELYKSIDSHEEKCCHQGSSGDRSVKCPPLHNCQLCNDVHLG
jgi:hypothetical protein